MKRTSDSTEMKKPHLFFGALALIIIIGVISNPDLAKHKEAVKTKLKLAFQKESYDSVPPQDGYEKTGYAIGTLLSGFMFDKIVDNVISSRNYLIFSTTDVLWEGERRMIGIGVFGYVYLSDKVDSILNKNNNNQSNTIPINEKRENTVNVAQLNIEKGLNDTRTELNNYKGMNSQLDSLLSDANKKIDAQDSRIKKLSKTEKSASELNNKLKGELDELRKMREEYLSKIDSLLVNPAR